MKKIAALAGLFTLAACGPGWDGRYTGILSELTSCSDGSGGAPGTVDVDWTVKETSTGLEIQTTGNCSPLLADISGEVATIRPKYCPTFSNNGVSFLPVMSGTARLGGGLISADLTTRMTASGAASGTCISKASGTLNQR